MKKISKLIKSTKFELFVVIVFFIAGFGVRLYKINSPIADWHSWRQVDTASVARIYVDEGIDLLTPRYYDISSIQTGYFNPQGLRFVEFPIYNVIHAIFYKSFPVLSFEVWGRLVSILSTLIAAYAIYDLGKKYIGKVGGLASLFFFLFLPFNIFFSRVILPEPMSVMFAVIAVWQFARYAEKGSVLSLIISASSFALGLLVKPYIIFFAIPMAYIAVRKFGIKGILTKIPHYIALNIILIPFILWRGWIDNGNNGLNYMGIPHLKWAFNGDNIRFRPSFFWWIFGDRLGSMILGIWGIYPFAMGLVSKTKKFLIPELMIFSMFVFVSVVATANVRHDYYQTLIIPAVALVLGKGTEAILGEKANIKSKLLLGACVFLMMLISAYRIKENYKVNHPEVIEVGKIADEILPKDALVIAPDNSNTVFLYHTKRFGWPVIETNIDDHIKLGADYYISVNNDADTAKFRERFEAVKQDGLRWIILDLHKEKKK